MLTVRDTKRRCGVGSVDFLRIERPYNWIHSFESFMKINPCANGQRSCRVVPHENREGTQNKLLLQLSKEIWDYLIKNEIMISAEYHPGAINKEANFQPRNVKDSSEWKLNPVVFSKTFHWRGIPDLDLFVSRVSHQVSAYMSWKLDPQRKFRNAFQISWTHIQSYAFPSFSLIV